MEFVNKKYQKEVAKVQFKYQYFNMKEKIEPHKYVIDFADEATKMAGIEPIHTAIRGGTDGATISYMGMPCPNLGTGGHAFHGPYEHITKEGMEKVKEIAKNIVKLCASK